MEWFKFSLLLSKIVGEIGEMVAEWVAYVIVSQLHRYRFMLKSCLKFVFIYDYFFSVFVLVRNSFSMDGSTTIHERAKKKLKKFSFTKQYVLLQVS